jgi:hypothetical protein
MAKVEVGRGLLIGGGLALGSALLAVVFLLGREAGRKGVPSSQAAPSPIPAAGVGAPSSAAIPGPGGGPAAGLENGPAPSEPERAAVRAYFAALDDLAPGQLAGDPESLARELVAGLARGDTSGFEQLIGQAEVGRRKLAGLQPPQPCAAHHRTSLADMDESLAVMRTMKKALEGAESESSLSALGLRANALRVRAEALQREEQLLRQRFGLTR